MALEILRQHAKKYFSFGLAIFSFAIFGSPFNVIMHTEAMFKISSQLDFI